MDIDIYTVVVAYNSNEEIFKGINSYINFVKKIYIVDNGNSSILKDIINQKELSHKIEYLSFNENLGIAKAINIVASIVQKEGGNWLLTMDQDSYFENFEILYNYFLADTDKKQTGIYAPSHITGHRVYPTETMSLIKNVMTSGNIVNLEVFFNIGSLDERFFIDRVDHDFCLTIIENHYFIKRINECRLIHHLGSISDNAQMEITNHSPLRRYYITRNTFYFLEKHFRKNTKYCTRYFINFIKDNINVLKYEKDRKNKLKYIRIGFYDYMTRKSGIYRPKQIK